MPWAAAAVVGSAVIGAYSSNKASKTAADSAKSGMNQSSAMSESSRSAAIDLYNRSKQSGRQGLVNAYDFYQKNAQSRYQPMIGGNMMAQKVIGQGATQANNAILGLPVDMSFANQPQQVQYDKNFMLGGKLADAPADFVDPTIAQKEQAAVDAAAAAKAKEKEEGTLAFRLDPKNAWSNPNRDIKKLGKKLGF
jgi:hypothetical protein